MNLILGIILIIICFLIFALFITTQKEGYQNNIKEMEDRYQNIKLKYNLICQKYSDICNKDDLNRFFLSFYKTSEDIYLRYLQTLREDKKYQIMMNILITQIEDLIKQILDIQRKKYLYQIPYLIERVKRKQNQSEIDELISNFPFGEEYTFKRLERLYNLLQDEN